MKIAEILHCLECMADPALQENYDNTGLLTGNPVWECPGVLVTLDATEEVVEEAAALNCNLIVAHHPIIFHGLKKITGRNYVEKTVISAIKKDIAIYAIHTNLDNILAGVNGRMADRLGLVDRKIISPRPGSLRKIYTFAPLDYAEKVRAALFEAGAGHIGNYSETSFNSEGSGTYKAGSEASPFLGKKGERHTEKETRVEVIFPSYLQQKVIKALLEAHPYEEVAYDVVSLGNADQSVGSGLWGRLPEKMKEQAFLAFVRERFQLPLIRHTRLNDRAVENVALCGGAGSFLIFNALSLAVDFFITSDIKYHEFFEANDQMVIADIGHFESEQFTVELIHDKLREKFPNFAVLKSGVKTNPVHYYL